MERQLSQRTVEAIDRQLEFMQMEQHDIMNGRVQTGPESGGLSDYPGLKDFDGFEELNAGGGEVVLEEVIVSSEPGIHGPSEPAGVPIEEDPNGFKSENLYYELTELGSSYDSSDLSLKTEGHSEESDPEYVPAGAPKPPSRKRKSRNGTSDQGPGRPAKSIKGSYTPKYKTEQSKPGPKAKVPDSELSPEELARRKQRRARNREAANRQRDKRVARVNDLESQVHSLQEENSSLKRENSSLKNELEKLRKQMEQANKPIMNQNQFIMNGQVYTQGTNMNGQHFVLQMVPSQQGQTNQGRANQGQTKQGQAIQGQSTQFLTKTLESPRSSRSTPNSVSTNGMNSFDQSQVQIGNQVYTGPLPSPFTQVLLMSPSMPIGTQFQFPVTSGATVDPVQAAAFQKTVGSL